MIVQMKKISLLLAFLFILTACPVTALAAAPDRDINASGVYLYNLDADTLVYEKNTDRKHYPAALTTVMTAILAIEYCEEQGLDLDATMVTYPNYVQDWLYSYQYGENGHGEVSKGGLMAGEELPMRELLYAMLLASANEASMIIADHIAGSQEDFAEMMTRRAKELGAANTHFANSTGLHDPDHYTTPRDMALIAKHAIGLPGFMDIVLTRSRTYGPTNMHESLTWNTKNLMMLEGDAYYYPALRGIKTGAVEESGNCFVSTATRDGFTYLLVVMGADIYDSDGERYAKNLAFDDTMSLYEWVFDTYKRKSLLEKGKYVKEIPLRLSSEKDFLQLMTAERFTALVPGDINPDEDVQKIYDLPDYVEAPVNKNDVIGTATLVLAGEVLGTVELVAAETVAASPILLILEQVKAVARSFWFKFALLFILLLIVVYIVLMILRNRRRRRLTSFRPRRRL